MMKPKPSVQLYTVRDLVADDLDLTLQKIAEIGFTQVEPYGFVDRADEYAQLLPKYGLTAPTGHAALIGKDVKPILEAAKSLGIKTLIDPFTQPEDWKDVEKISGFANELNRISEQAKSYDIVIGYHNHYWELAERVDGEIAFDFFISKLNQEIVIELDAFWCEVGGVSAPDYLKKLGGRVVAIHVKDGTKDGNLDNQVPAGTGEIPIKEILESAPHAIPVVEFDRYTTGEIFAGVEQSLAFIEENR